MKTLHVLLAAAITCGGSIPLLAKTSGELTPLILQVAPDYFEAKKTGQSNVFTEGETVRLRLLVKESGANPWQALALDWQVQNFERKTIAEGKSTITVANDKAVLILEDLPASVGWYSITVNPVDTNANLQVRYDANDESGLDRGAFVTYAVVPKRVERTHEYFGLDVAYSTSQTIPAETLIDTAAKVGASWIRDRFSPRSSWPEDDVWNFALYEKYAKQTKELGMSTLQVFHSFPRRYSAEPDDIMPEDLLAVYQFFKRASQNLGEYVHAWEIWNEQDIAHFGDRTPDYFASIVKAAALGLADGNAQTQRILGPFARDPNVGDYAELLFASDVTPYLNGYAFHTYAPIKNGLLDHVLDVNLKLAQSEGFGPESVWLSETGEAFSRKGTPDFMQAARSNAVYLAQDLSISLSRGIGHTFIFLLRPHLGGGPSQFGLLRLDGSPFPALVSYAVTTNELANADRYLGKLKTEGAYALVFQAGAEQLTVAWSMFGHKRLDLPGKATDWRAKDALGQIVAIDSTDGYPVSVMLDDLPIFIKGSQWNNEELISPLEALKAPARKVIEKRIVLQPRLAKALISRDGGSPQQNWDGMASRWAPRDYTATRSKPLEIPMRLYNLGEVQKSGHLMIQSGLREEAIHSDTLIISPLSYVDFSWTIDPPEEGVTAETFETNGIFGELAISRSTFRIRWKD